LLISGSLQVDQELLRKRYVELGGTDIDTDEPVTSAGNEETTPTRMAKNPGKCLPLLQDPMKQSGMCSS
jgi:hypothetical protein